ncbi:hypothetical protein [Amycolatopsis alba]|uniref:Uncharacterized protein n=1 Tax=Amycolatopsis alba DSM 44262 TaxID=1125972 RepID=A0A229RLG3_AMYAL|nr:hypothetical protein [Amycolatopsis alba]OXM47500.1 hypothetical protein CFP75_23740 [Amycolatopsis alba DSM 44262]
MLHAIPDEHYVEFVADGLNPNDHPSFPARVVDIPLTTSRFGAHARLRAEVLPSVQQWITKNPQLGMGLQLLPADKHRSNDLPLKIDTTGALWQRTLIVWPDDGLYELSGDTTWFLQISVPTTTADTIRSLHRELVKPANLRPEPGEALVNLADAQVSFPAIVDNESWIGAAVPYFRPEVAKILGAWLNYAHLTLDDTYARTYWEGDTLIVVESNAASMPGYHPDHVEPRPDGRYAIGWREWVWEAV